MHTALYRPFFFDFSIFTGSFLNELAQFLTRCSRSLSGAFLGLLNNRSLKSRLSGVGQVSRAKVQTYGLSGILARSAGVFTDQRYFNNTLAGHATIASRTFLGKRGDNLDRFLLRVKETAESFRVLSQSLQSFKFSSKGRYVKLDSNKKNYSAVTLTRVKVLGLESHFATAINHLNFIFFFSTSFDFKLKHNSVESLASSVRLASSNVVQAIVQPSRGKYSSMESLITHFRLTSEGWPTDPGFSYKSIESPKGEVGVTLISNGTSKPTRLKLRTPVSHNMHLIPTISVGSVFADFVATFCSLDIVLGEIDR